MFKQVQIRENGEKEPGKIKRWFVARLEHLFGIDRIKTRLDEYALDIKIALGNAARYEEECRTKVERYEQIAVLLDNAKVGVDVAFGKQSRSWAVVCLVGKKEGVYFYQFPDNNVEEIRRFLLNFNRQNQTIDCPYGFPPNYFY